jgi:hypothetical protein
VLRRIAERAPRRLRGVAYHVFGCGFVPLCGAVGLPLGLLVAYAVGSIG